MIRVVLVDDEELVCVYLRKILEGSDADIEVVGYALDGDEAVQVVARVRPEVVLLDLRMPGVGGLATLGNLRALQDPPQVVVLTGYDDDRAVLRALRSGAAGYLLKSTPPRDLASAVRLAAAGHQVLGEGVPRVTAGEAVDKSTVRGLTSRETEVLQLLGDGLSNAVIADSLGVTEATVKGHVSAVMAKLGCESRLQAGLAAHDLWRFTPRGD